MHHKARESRQENAKARSTAIGTFVSRIFLGNSGSGVRAT